MDFKAGLVLEGGGMRGVYSAGVLDYFLDHDIHLAHCYGVSAGAVIASNYISKQRGRSLRTTVNYINDKRYCSFRNLLFTKNIFGTDFLYNRIPNELDIFEYDAFLQSSNKMTAVVSDIESGKACYREFRDLREDMNWLRASCSLPFLAQIVEIDGRKYLDGGLSDSIPLQKACEDGYQKNIVILTRPEGYQKKQERVSALMGQIGYAKYPKMVKESKLRYLKYNQQLAFIKEQEELGNIFVFRPSASLKIGRLEKDTDKLTALYEQGYQDAKKHVVKILQFLDDVSSCKG